jgi:glycosyltransferase involved in cell wall biosynthesis
MAKKNTENLVATDPHMQKMLSVVIPAHNEAKGISQVLSVIIEVLSSCEMVWEIIVIDDGSQDGTFAQLKELASNDKRLKGMRFSRNFGKEAAILAGLRAAEGDAVVTIDADLQHPPQLIPMMIDEWRHGAKVVNAVKRRRENDGLFKRIRAKIFNTVLSRLGGVDLNNSSDFKLLDRLVVNTIVKELPERKRFYRGLSNWVGYAHANIPFDVEGRTAGEGKWTSWRLIELATTAIVSFTSAPLRIVTILGFITLIFGFLVATEALVSWTRGIAVSGFMTLIFTLLIIGSFIMISLGVVGEYIAKIYEEIKQRPPYLVEDKIRIDED